MYIYINYMSFPSFGFRTKLKKFDFLNSQTKHAPRVISNNLLHSHLDGRQIMTLKFIQCNVDQMRQKLAIQIIFIMGSRGNINTKFRCPVSSPVTGLIHLPNTLMDLQLMNNSCNPQIIVTIIHNTLSRRHR